MFKKVLKDCALTPLERLEIQRNHAAMKMRIAASYLHPLAGEPDPTEEDWALYREAHAAYRIAHEAWEAECLK